MKILLENIRTFDQEQTIDIRPLTILTGENSSGKSTLINCIYHGAKTFGGMPLRLPASEYFHDFDNIASYKGGRFGRASHYMVGFEYKFSKGTYSIKYKVKNNGGASELASADLLVKGKLIEIIFHGTDRYTIKVNGKIKEGVRSVDMPEFFKQRISDYPLYIVYQNNKFISSQINEKNLDLVFNLMDGRHLKQFELIAPIRSRPKKTYDNSVEVYSMEGDHIPYLFRNAYTNMQKDPDIRLKIALLKEFGQESGLFTDIKPRKLGRHINDPFQMFVAVNGPLVNMTEVGYGVSQSFPILINAIFGGKKDFTYLIQQPEVHLHPRAQAALGTLFAKLVKEKICNFIIETHSDYIVDRIRKAIREGGLSHGSVSLLHLLKKKASTSVCRIELDKFGNIVDPPSAYRSFFIREEMEMLK